MRSDDTMGITRAGMVIRAALTELPERCRYHGDSIEGRDLWRFAGACCATGEPSLHRRRALAALDNLDSHGRALTAEVVGLRARLTEAEASLAAVRAALAPLSPNGYYGGGGDPNLEIFKRTLLGQIAALAAAEQPEPSHDEQDEADNRNDDAWLEDRGLL